MGHEDLVPFCSLKSLLDFGIAPIGPGVQHLKVYEPNRFVDGMEGNAGHICDVGSKANISPGQNGRTHLQEKDIQETSVFLSPKHHWVVGPKAQVHVLVQALESVKITTELITSRRRYRDAGSLEFCQGAQAAELADQREVLAVREMEEATGFGQEDWLCSRVLGLFRMALANGAA